MEIHKKLAYRYCIVPKCKSTSSSTPDKVFFRVPNGTAVRQKWCRIMKRDMISPTSSLHCCEDHFNVEDDSDNYIQYKIMTLQGYKNTTLRLKKGIFPHIFQCQSDSKSKPAPPRKAFLKRRHLEIINEALSAPPAKQSVLTVAKSSKNNYLKANISCISSLEDTQTTKILEQGCNTSSFNVYNKNNLHVDNAVQVSSKIHFRRRGVNAKMFVKKKNTAVPPIPIQSKTTSLAIAQTSEIKKKLFQDNLADIASISSAQLTVSSSEINSDSSSIEDDSDKEKQFKSQMRSCMLLAVEMEPKLLLGLPKRSYYLIKLLSESIPLPIIDILITLKKIKLNESFRILALQFGYTQSTISKIFSKSILLIAEKMKALIVWPSPAEILKHLPISFRVREYSNVVSIIDCLEIQIEKPTNAVHQSLTWSQYKKCHTFKYLISFTPDGLVSFISDGYSGSITDVMIVEDSGYLESLPPNTAVMADRGFKDISYLLGKKDCTLIRPPSVSKSTPSTQKGVKESKHLAAVKIHVERVISRLREYHMLLPHACVDYNLMPVIDQVIVIACGLINMQDVLIKD